MRGRSLSLKYVANPRRSSYRAAVIVSKKVHKSAVVRNRIRRRVYEVIRTNVDSAQAFDFAFLLYDETFATMPAEQLQQSIIGLLTKAGLAAAA